MRGQGTSAWVIIVIFLSVVILFIYFWMANNQVQTNIKLNQESLQIMKLKSAFNLFNASLGTTWLISTTQAIFKTGDEGVGCGYDNTQLPPDYWYRLDPTKLRDADKDNGGNTIERIPGRSKYNSIGRNPQICYPRDNDVVAYIKAKLRDGGYLNLKMPVDAGGVAINIATDSGRIRTNIAIDLADNYIDGKFSQQITASIASGRIVSVTENDNRISTSLRLMVTAARNTVDYVLQLGDSMYASPPVPYDTNNADYQTRIRNIIDNSARILPIPDTVTITEIRTELNASHSGVAGVIPRDSSGLVLHYIARIRYIESSLVATPSAAAIRWPVDSRGITSCYGYRTDPLTESTAFHSGLDIGGGPEDVFAVEAGTVEDVVSDCVAGDVSCGGGYGNRVLINHAPYGAFYSFYSHLESVSVAEGQVITPGTIIGRTGTTGRSTGVHLHFEIRKEDYGSEDPCLYIDCAQSTGKICQPTSLSSSSTRGVYYYEDEDRNLFIKRPIELQYVIEDYFPALDCTKVQPNPPAAVLYSWNSPDDMACCAGLLFSCNADIPNLASDHKLVTGESTDNNVPDQSICNGLLGRSIQCTASGFQ